MQQTDVKSIFVNGNSYVTQNRSRLKGAFFSPTAATNPNAAFVDATVSISGTYSQTTTTITVTATAHGLSVGQRVAIAITSGSAAGGGFAVATVPDANTFTVTTPLTGTNSGNATVYTNFIMELGVAALTQNSVVIPGEGILAPNGIYYVGIPDTTVFYG